MRRYGATTTAIYVFCAERLRGGEDLATYLLKIRRTLDDLIAGRPVRPWRLDRLRRYFEEVAACARRAATRTNRCGW